MRLECSILIYHLLNTNNIFGRVSQKETRERNMAKERERDERNVGRRERWNRKNGC